MASTAPAAKAHLLATLKAIPELNTVSITYGSPTETEDIQPEMIYFDGPTTRTPSWRVLAGGAGLAPLDEDYRLTVRIALTNAGDDEVAAEQRCWELVGIVELAVRADLTFGGLLRGAADTPMLAFGEQTVETIPHSDAWGARGTVPLLCHARV